MNDVNELCVLDDEFEESSGEDWPYTIGEDELKLLDENASFEERARQELAAQCNDNLWRQERRNVSLLARGNNHYRKVHCAKIKARKGWR